MFKVYCADHSVYLQKLISPIAHIIWFVIINEVPSPCQSCAAKEMIQSVGLKAPHHLFL
jgi:hypothetical protein